ncbi:phage tail protein [Micromonospora sp. NPDC047707]|uniref:phage tail protein n=1 Tax=Micromonospora sp. NPDC047707 TaxID=3154498 RepID=UPI00345332E2
MSERFLRMVPPALLNTGPAGADTPPLLALLTALEEQWLLLAADVDRVLDDAFPDSAADWALPYLGALLGLPPDADRREIAYATALRRRKGTPAALEDFAEVVTGWSARVREGWTATVWCQQLRHPVRRTASLDLRNGEHLLAGTGLDPARRSVTPGGSFHPAAATVQVFPWQVLGYEQVQVAPLGGGRFALHPLGGSAPLYLRPRPLEIASDAEDERPPGEPPAPRRPRTPDELPVRATWRLIDALGDVSYGPVWTLAADHPLTGDGPALLELTVDGVPLPWAKIGLTALPPAGSPAAPAGTVLVDPYRGVVKPAGDVPGTLRATFYRAVPGRLGAVASTAETRDDAGVVIVVDPASGPHPAGQIVVPTLTAAFAAATAATSSSSEPDAPQVEIRLLTSDRLAAPAAPVTGTPTLTRWRVVAPTGCTPVVTGDLSLQLTDVRIELCGFLLAGALRIGAQLAGVDLVGMTGDPTSGHGIDVDPTAWTVRLAATRCLLGPIRADLSAYPIQLTDCVVDGRGAALMPCGGDPGGDPTRAAIAAADRFPPDLVATGVTFVGPVGADEVWVTDCLFTGGLRTTVTSTGCVRYCHLGEHDSPQAHPPAYHCLTGPLPRFGGIGFDSAGYYAPVVDAPSARPSPALLTGASDGGEIGAYHHARRGPLAARLAQRLPEMTPLTVHPHLSVAHPEE